MSYHSYENLGIIVNANTNLMMQCFVKNLGNVTITKYLLTEEFNIVPQYNILFNYW